MQACGGNDSCRCDAAGVAHAELGANGTWATQLQELGGLVREKYDVLRGGFRPVCVEKVMEHEFEPCSKRTQGAVCAPDIEGGMRGLYSAKFVELG